MFEELHVDGVVLVPEKPNWVHEGLSDDEASRYITSLVKFYVIETPIESLSARAKTVEYYGWNDAWKKPTWLNRKIKDASSNPKLFYSSHKHDGMELSIKKGGLFDFKLTNDHVEAACFFNSEKNQTLSLFKHIRNSLCHGRFAVLEFGDDIWVMMEDVTNRRKNDPVDKAKRLTARLLLKHSTLLAWQRLVVEGVEHEQ